MKTFWQTAKRRIEIGEKTLIMAILNVTPDSFSDGGRFFSLDKAIEQAEKLIAEGADIIDVGGESTRPSSEQISVEEEIRRIISVVKAVSENFNVPVSIDTTKSPVAEAAINAGAEIINDISGLRFDERIARIAAQTGAGLVLMHSLGDFATMHKQPAIENILSEVSGSFRRAIEKAEKFGINPQNIALDAGCGFSKSFDNNLELLAKMNKLVREFPSYPILVGVSRKSFIGKILGGVLPAERVNGSIATAAVSAWNGANIVRVHDVKATGEALKVIDELKKYL